MLRPLTDKEGKVFQAIVDNALGAMGGRVPKDLFEDNFSWFDRSDISERTDFGKHVISGVISALDKKGLISKSDTPGEWFLTDEGIQVAQGLYEVNQIVED